MFTNWLNNTYIFTHKGMFTNWLINTYIILTICPFNFCWEYSVIRTTILQTIISFFWHQYFFVELEAFLF